MQGLPEACSAAQGCRWARWAWCRRTCAGSPQAPRWGPLWRRPWRTPARRFKRRGRWRRPCGVAAASSNCNPTAPGEDPRGYRRGSAPGTGAMTARTAGSASVSALTDYGNTDGDAARIGPGHLWHSDGIRRRTQQCAVDVVALWQQRAHRRTAGVGSTWAGSRHRAAVGVLRPKSRATLHRAEVLREIAADGAPLPLVDGNGRVYGAYAITARRNAERFFPRWHAAPH